MMTKIALLFAVAAISPPVIAGDVYRCQDAVGKIEFRDRPCDTAQKGQKVDVTPNSVGTMTLEEVRAKTAELKARQQARQDTENKANADAHAARERAWQQEREAQGAVDLQQAIGDNGPNLAPNPYYNGDYPGQPLKPPATPRPPPPPLRSPAMPTPPPKPPTLG